MWKKKKIASCIGHKLRGKDTAWFENWILSGFIAFHCNKFNLCPMKRIIMLRFNQIVFVAPTFSVFVPSFHQCLLNLLRCHSHPAKRLVLHSLIADIHNSAIEFRLSSCQEHSTFQCYREYQRQLHLKIRNDINAHRNASLADNRRQQNYFNLSNYNSNNNNNNNNTKYMEFFFGIIQLMLMYVNNCCHHMT